MGTATVRQLIDSARTRHWAFADVQAGDGPALLFLNSRLRTHLAQHGAKIEGLVGTAMQYTVPMPGGILLVTSTGSILTTNFGMGVGVNMGLGQPIIGATYEDGWPIHVTGGGIPYVDFSEPPIAADPFVANGGLGGFPLPVDMIRLIAVSLSYNSNPATFIPCDVFTESERFSMMPSRNPAAFVSGNRLIPMLPLSAGNSADRWYNVSAISISYVGVQTLSSLDDVLNLPVVLTEALIADVTSYFAMQSKIVTPADKTMFRAESDRCGAAIEDAALEMLNQAEQDNVIYRG